MGKLVHSFCPIVAALGLSSTAAMGQEIGGTIGTNVSATAILNYDINSTTISAGSAAGVLLASTATESEFEDVTGLNFLDYFDSAKDAFVEFQEFGHPEDFASGFAYVTNYATNEYMNHWVLPDGWTMDVPGGSNFWSSIPTDLRNTIIGEYHPPTNGAVSGSGLGTPTIDGSWIFDIEQDVGNFNGLSDNVPNFEMWTVHLPVPNVGFLDLGGIYNFSLSEAKTQFKEAIGLSSSGSQKSSRLNIHIAPSFDFKKGRAASVDSEFSNKFRSSLESMVDAFFDKIADFDGIRFAMSGVCLAFYWIYVFVWFRRNSTPLIDGVMTLMWGAPPSSEPERDYDGYEL